MEWEGELIVYEGEESGRDTEWWQREELTDRQPEPMHEGWSTCGRWQGKKELATTTTTGEQHSAYRTEPAPPKLVEAWNEQHRKNR